MAWRIVLGLGLLGLSLGSVMADGPKDNIAENVRPIPPKGVTVPDADLEELRAGLAKLGKALADLPKELKRKPKLLELIPDVEIYYRAVNDAVTYNEFFDPKGGDVKAAKRLLTEGLKRASELQAGKPLWTTATGYVVRGYRSRIDDSAQPYGLHVPKDYDFSAKTKHRLDFWWHGRGETLSEVNFIGNTQNAGGVIPAAGAFILAPYGRYCNANKFAGEIDTFECLAHAKKHYRIDEDRLVARGFSMGGAACWQYAVHYPTLWAANAPGAGFAETPEFLNVFQKEKVEPTWYEKKLWHMYNATDYAQNLFNLPTVAYSGEVDSQKQAADVMAREMQKVGLTLKHLIGPKTGHSYHAETKKELNQLIDEIVAKGRDPLPKQIKFVTYTLQYNRSGWIRLDGLKKHWSPAKVDATLADGVAEIKTENVSALSLQFDKAHRPDLKKVIIDGTTFNESDSSKLLGVSFIQVDGKWVEGSAYVNDGPRKVPGLQGPIDDAFTDRFIFVSPTGKPINEKVGGWVQSEMKRAVEHWRKQFRGNARVVEDTALTPAEIAQSNLILWGDPQSNKVLAKIADKLPVKWTDKGVEFNGQTYDAGTHAPILILPNPLNPMKYVVLNSGFTYRDYDYLNNARQVPKLPDYAIVDVSTPPGSRYPGKIVRAGFFGERWEVLPNDGQ